MTRWDISDFFHEYRNVNDLSNADSHGYGSIDLGLGGSYSSSYGSASCLTIDICPDLLFAGLAAAAAAGFAFYYISITMAGKRRKRRSVYLDIGTTFYPTSSFVRGNCKEEFLLLNLKMHESKRKWHCAWLCIVDCYILLENI